MKQNSVWGIFKYLVYLLCITRRNMCKQYFISYTFSSFFCLWDQWGILNMHFYFGTQSEFLSLLLGWSFWCVWWCIFVCCVSIRITKNRRIDFDKNDILEIFSLAFTLIFFLTFISWVLNLWNVMLVNWQCLFITLYFFCLIWPQCISCSHCLHLLYCTCDFSLFFKQEMELSLIGLQNAGKTSLVNVVAVSKSGQWLN